METGNYYNNIPLHPILQFIKSPRYRWLRHTLFIIAGLILAFQGDIIIAEQLHWEKNAVRALILFDTGLFLILMSTLYVTIYILIPALLFRSRIFLFAMAFLTEVSVIYFFTLLLDRWFLRPVFPGNDVLQHMRLSFGDYIEKGLISAILIGCVTGFTIFRKWIEDMQRMNEIQQINLKSELQQLKSQVNPHFLFNTLNNLLVLTKTNPEKASQVLLGLSDLLRYQLYDSAKEKILLTKDIDFINNLLALEKIRKDDFSYEVTTEGDIEGRALPPFLFIPFVENAIKHGASSVGYSYLKLSFHTSDERLSFYAENSKPPIRNYSTGGIGLKNIRRRLELLYHKEHTLEITDSPSKYVVQLTIPL